MKYNPENNIEKVKGVGPVNKKKLKRHGIKTVGDLLNYFPFRYEDRSEMSNLAEIEAGKKYVIKGKLENITSFKTKSGQKLVKATFYDETGETDITWFNSTYLLNILKEDKTYVITGKTNKYRGRVVFTNPQVDKSSQNPVHTGRIVPIYFNVPKLSMKSLRKYILEAVENTEIIDYLNETELNGSKEYMELKEAYKNLHFPKKENLVENAKDRIALNELVHVKLHGQKLKKINKNQSAKFSISKVYNKNLIKELPFELTGDQKDAVKTLQEELKNDHPMNALLTGDVGSGKTIVSVASAYDVVNNGGKVTYLAPTLVLAEQVYKEYKDKMPSDINIQKATANEKPKGDWDILIGTHALLNIEEIDEKTDYVIIDEQHKFGVKQRAKIIKDKNSPHVLTMTATPIPRSLALTYFGELELIQIKEKPKGRKEIKTKVLPERKRKDCFMWLRDQVLDNQKVYYIVPFIEQSNSENFEDIKSIEDVAPKLKDFFGEDNVSVLHGRLKDKEKNDIMNEFKKKEGGILLSTQVIEVGVDVKEATVIIIESAERFGLASLHQLRGRVGRNNLESYCFLFTSNSEKQNIKRLQFMEKESDGFKLSKLDLENRGSGEIFGLRQSGEIDLKFVDFSKTNIIEDADKIAKKLFKDTKRLENYNNNYFTRDFFYIKDN